MSYFEEIVYTGIGEGRLVLKEDGIEFREGSGGGNHVIEKEDLSTASWSVFGRSGHLLLLVKETELVRLQGFSTADFNDIRDTIKANYGLDVEQTAYSSEAYNCGNATFDGANIHFEVEGKPVFEIPLSGITQCVVPKTSRKREVEIQFSEADALGGEDTLVEVRFGFLDQEGKEEEGEEDPLTPAEAFHSLVSEKQHLWSKTGGDEQLIITLPSDLGTFHIPRGKYEIEVYPSYLRMHGTSYDYKVRWADVKSSLKLPLPGGSHDAIVLNLAKPLRHGKQRYAHVILNAQTQPTDLTVSDGISEAFLQEHFEDKIPSTFSGPFSNTMAKIVRFIGKTPMHVPDNFVAANNENRCVHCLFGANDGLIFFFAKFLIFIHKPTIILEYKHVGHVIFKRLHTTSSTYEMKVVMRAHGEGRAEEYLFNSIQLAEVPALKAWFAGKKVEALDQSETSDMKESAAFMQALDEELGVEGGRSGGGQGVGEMEEEDESEDEDFGSDQVSSTSESESEEEEEEDDEEEEESPSKKKRRRRPKEEEEEEDDEEEGSPASKKQKKRQPAKKKKDKNAPKKAVTAFAFFSKHNRAKIKEEHPEASFSELSKLVGQRWKSLTKDERQPYDEEAAQDKERYARDMEAYEASKLDDINNNIFSSSSENEDDD